MYDLCSGTGAHEVVIETPDHTVTLGGMPTKQIEEIIWACKARSLELSKDRRFRYVMIFRNEGSSAGASLIHPHTQIIALPIVPKRVEEEIAGAKRHFQFKERCIFLRYHAAGTLGRDTLDRDQRTFCLLRSFRAAFPL